MQERREIPRNSSTKIQCRYFVGQIPGVEYLVKVCRIIDPWDSLQIIIYY